MVEFHESVIIFRPVIATVSKSKTAKSFVDMNLWLQLWNYSLKKIQAWTGFESKLIHDLSDTGAVLYRLSYQANWNPVQDPAQEIGCSA